MVNRGYRPGARPGRRLPVAAALLLLWPTAVPVAEPPASSGTSAPATAPTPAPTPSAAPTPAPANAGPEGPAAAPGGEAKPTREVVGTITGAVYDASKKPLVGWMVQLSSRGQDGLLRATGTDEKGRYVFKDLPAGSYDIEVGAGGEAARRKGRIEVRPPFRNIVDFQIGGPQDAKASPLAAGIQKAVEAAGRADAPDATPAGEPGQRVPVKGMFVDAQKRPIPDVSVTFVPLEGGDLFQAFSGMDGTFEMAAVPPGRYRVLVSSPGHVSLDLKSVEVAKAKGLNLSLSLVDYPLNMQGRPGDRLPAEEPIPAPAPTTPPS